MKIGFLSDAHGNPVMLAACLQELRRLETSSIYFLGDAVGYFPGDAEVFRILRSEAVQCQKGNHDAMLLGELPLPANKDRVYGIAAARERISPVDRDYIMQWPEHRLLQVDGKKLLLVHGSPRNYLQGYVYPDGDLSMFDNLEYDAVLMGHTHYPFTAQRGQTLVVNVGSCGLPRDRGDLPAFAIMDVKTFSCSVYRVQFSVEKVLDYFGNQAIAPEITDCLYRKSTSPVFGCRIEGTDYK